MSSANAQTFGETMRRNRKMNLPLFIFSFAATFLVALVGRLTNKKYIQSVGKASNSGTDLCKGRDFSD